MLPYWLKRRLRRTRRQGRSIQRWRRRLRWAGYALLVIVAVDLFYLTRLWPDWQVLARSPVAKSQFIKQYEARHRQDRQLPALRWRPVPAKHIPAHTRRAVIAAEDARFYHHRGFDLEAFRDAMQSNLEIQQFRYGGSTISQQLVKNMFLSAARTPLRKWHELVLTVGMELSVSKRRILHTYLNIAEFGEGVYGVEAAARHYWQVPVSRLQPWQSAQLAACLPSPKRHNPATTTKRFLKRARKILGYLSASG